MMPKFMCEKQGGAAAEATNYSTTEDIIAILLAKICHHTFIHTYILA